MTLFNIAEEYSAARSNIMRELESLLQVHAVAGTVFSTSAGDVDAETMLAMYREARKEERYHWRVSSGTNFHEHEGQEIVVLHIHDGAEQTHVTANLLPLMQSVEAQ